MDFLKDQEEHLNSNRKHYENNIQEDQFQNSAYIECTEFDQTNLDL